MRVIITFLGVWIAIHLAGVQEMIAQEKSQTTLFLSGSHTLQARIYKPKGKGPFPAVIFNQHSTKPLPSEGDPFPALAKIFNTHGYVFFVPGRHEFLSSSDEN